MTTLAGLECPPYPSRRYPGDDDRSQASRDDEDQVDPPTDGRQLLGWAAKQVPDAKLDRLVRSTSVMDYIKRSGVPFTACDNPFANKLTIDILVAVAAHEARMISQRTRDALQAYRDGKRVSRRIREMYPDGVPADVVEATAGKLGAELPQCRNLGDAQKLGTVAAAARRSREAAAAYDG
jgi:hypothetical protein